MANVLTNLIPDLYEALDVVSRELVGMIPAVRRDAQITRAAINENVIIPVTPEVSGTTNTPAVTAPDTGDQTIDNITVTISKSEHVPVRWNGEETKGLMNSGMFSSIQAQRFYQAMRYFANQIENDLWVEGYTNSSRAYGTAGTAPFGTAGDFADFAGVRRILDDNGAPQSDLQLVLGNAAIQNLRGKQSVLFKANEAGSSDMLRNGMTDRIEGMAIRQSGQIGVHAKGAGANYDFVSGGEAIGQTTLSLEGGTVNSTGFIAGDIITHAGDSVNKYVVTTGLTATSGDIVIGSPGLLVAGVDANEITIGGSYTPNLAFDRNALILATRMPAMPEGGDAAEDVVQIVDDKSGLAFEIALYKQFLQNVYHVRAAWGVGAVKQAHIATLIG